MPRSPRPILLEASIALDCERQDMSMSYQGRLVARKTKAKAENSMVVDEDSSQKGITAQGVTERNKLHKGPVYALFVRVNG